MVPRGRRTRRPEAIVAEARALADFDVLLRAGDRRQLSRSTASPATSTTISFVALAALLPAIAAAPGIAVDHPAQGVPAQALSAT
jgi:hypothetical protein